MINRVDASLDALLRQSKETGEDYFRAAERVLGKSELVEEYTAADVIALAKVMADDFRNTTNLLAGQNIADAINNLASRIPE